MHGKPDQVALTLAMLLSNIGDTELKVVHATPQHSSSAIFDCAGETARDRCLLWSALNSYNIQRGYGSGAPTLLYPMLPSYAFY
jgi:hypothetical protein